MLNDISNLFKALGDKNRLLILELLCKDTELCVTDICRNFRMRQPSISHHLAILRRAGLVVDRKDGKEVYYSINRMHIKSSIDNYISRLAVVVIEED